MGDYLRENKMKFFAALLFLFCHSLGAQAQLFINEGSNRNYTSIPDENMDYPDWIELYNPSPDTIELLNFSLSDDPAMPTKWVFPNVIMLPGEYKVVFCSGKDRKPISGFVQVLNTGTYTPVVGWNNHILSSPYFWDGVSGLLINTCSYSGSGYTTNSVFNQSSTAYNSTIYAFQDGSPYICDATYGTKVAQRPNIRLNGFTVGTGNIHNSDTDYPAPYGNWYWAAKNQMFIPASELSAAGLISGDITSLAFDVFSTNPGTVYDYIEISMKLVTISEVASAFDPADTNNYLHTNFKISSSGETVYLYDATQNLISSLFVNSSDLNNSNGLLPDSSSNVTLFQTATPAASNNASTANSGYLLAPQLSVQSGIYNMSFTVSVSNPNTVPCELRFTTNGSDPTTASALYTGTPISVPSSRVVKVRAFAAGMLPSPIAVSTYLLNVSHHTPILSVVTNSTNLYGTSGIFTHWELDWEKNAYVEYFDSTHQLIFSQAAGMQVDGGAGGSRSHPQHSFRVELDDPVLGSGPIDYALIPNRAYRDKYSKLYLRNGSNQYLDFPYKDACQTQCMGGASNAYYAAWRPVTVYINGSYFGLYELREKIDAEYLKETDDANPDSVDILTQSYWGGGVLRPTQGSVDDFYYDYNAFLAFDPANANFWDQADQYFDLQYYNDYIIAESWIGNVDWPWNNIKITRSDKSDYRWRFCLIDMELAFNPNGWTDCYYDHINFMLGQDPNIPYINIWLRGMQNTRFRNYFINRFADLMNTSYAVDRLLNVENSFYNQTVLDMPDEYERWGNPSQIPQQMNDFANRHSEFQFQLMQRTDQVRTNIVTNFGLNGLVDVTLTTVPAGAGRIQISTIIPDSLPWTGVYFDGNPVRLTAIPNQGYQFAYWSGNSVVAPPDTNISFELNIPNDTTFVAVFIIDPDAAQLTVSEVNFHSDSTRDAGDWVEFHNIGNKAMDVSGWKFSDSVYTHVYTFPNGTIVAPDAYLVLAEDTALFHAQHLGVPVLGPMGFGFSNSDEALLLKDFTNRTMLWMHYDDSLPWQPAADGYGRTLELRNDSADITQASSWFAGCIGGSPGAAYSPCSEQLIFSEINYKSLVTADAGDWVEIHNIGSSSVDISNWKFRDGDDLHTYTVPAGTLIAADEYLVLYSDSIKFSNRFPYVNNIIGPFTFGLSSDGDAIRLFDASGILYQSLIYDDTIPWPLGAAGNGFTLELINPLGIFCDGGNWMTGCFQGSPGGPYTFPCPGASINEANNDAYFLIYPNPSNGKFTLALKDKTGLAENLFIDIYNQIGVSVYSTILSNQSMPFEIDISNHPDGIYYIRVQSDIESYTYKLTIQSN